MGECPKKSGQIPFVLPRPVVIGAAVTAPIPFAVAIDLEFSEAMQTGLVPANANVEAVVDSVPVWGTFGSWTDATHARYSFNIGWPPPVNASVQLKVVDPNLKNIAGGACRVSDVFILLP